MIKRVLSFLRNFDRGNKSASSVNKGEIYHPTNESIVDLLL